MTAAILHFCETFFALCSSASAAYYLLCLWSAWKFSSASEGNSEPSFIPPVSILKPVRGIDPGMYEAFCSHCRQHYGEFEIIFGVSEANDPALELVERLQREFPPVEIHYVVCGPAAGTNIKASNLAQMVKQAKHEHLVVNDSDISVPEDYLARVIAPLADKTNGLVTCLYRGIAGRTTPARLEALGISTDFAAGVLVAQQVEGDLSFALGSTMVFRKSDLAAAGGFEALQDFLADDYELGRRIVAQGKKVVLSRCVVETGIGDYTWGQFFDHQLRWARTVRDARRWGYLGFGVTFGAWWALLTLLAAGGATWAWALLVGILVLRDGVALMVGWRILADRTALNSVYLIPIRDIIGFWIWLAGWFGNRVKWRGQEFLLKNGRLVRPGSHE